MKTRKKCDLSKAPKLKKKYRTKQQIKRQIDEMSRIKFEDLEDD